MRHAGRMGRFFNIAGPCIPTLHYMLPPEDRCRGMDALIEQGLYFVIHAARQSGKTTLLQSAVHALNKEGRRLAVYCSLETLRTVKEQKEAIPAIIGKLEEEARLTPGLESLAWLDGVDLTRTTNALNAALRRLAALAPKPVVLFFDEADCLAEEPLLSFLAQLRDGYVNRSRAPFIHTLGLVGMRNIRLPARCAQAGDYKVKVREDSQTLGGVSPFNVVTEALTLRNFTEAEIAELYGQHTAETGQVFEPLAVARVGEQTGGQPWLVNAIARECVEKLLGRAFTQPVTTALVDQAIENIILRRDTHIDSLLERLKESRVRRVIEPVLVGDIRAFSPADDDYRYVVDLGLLTEGPAGLRAANPIYGEVLVRTLSWQAQLRMDDMRLNTPRSAYERGGGLDLRRLLGDFQQFWRENAEMMGDSTEYVEAVPHLVLQAFLQRVVNGGGRIHREFALGRQRMDLLIEYSAERYPVEIKLWRSEKTLAEGLAQLVEYVERVGRLEGWLVIFDRRPERPWDKRIYWREETRGNRTLHVVGC
ncbi:MAG: AAA-like domain-containing protein [Verrucomicrobia bacterium]|nr:AAA-like domain-containing protein [Verrucomicrobiota bacterium]